MNTPVYRFQAWHYLRTSIVLFVFTASAHADDKEPNLLDDRISETERIHLLAQEVTKLRSEIKQLKVNAVQAAMAASPGEYICTIDDLFIGKSGSMMEARTQAVKACVDQNKSFFFARDCRGTVKCEQGPSHSAGGATDPGGPSTSPDPELRS